MHYRRALTRSHPMLEMHAEVLKFWFHEHVVAEALYKEFLSVGTGYPGALQILRHAPLRRILTSLIS
jgi:hypothetical protein